MKFLKVKGFCIIPMSEPKVKDERVYAIAMKVCSQRLHPLQISGRNLCEALC